MSETSSKPRPPAAPGVAFELAMLLMFFVVLCPVALLLRLFGHDPLRRRVPRRGSLWQPVKVANPAERLHRQS